MTRVLQQVGNLLAQTQPPAWISKAYVWLAVNVGCSRHVLYVAFIGRVVSVHLVEPARFIFMELATCFTR